MNKFIGIGALTKAVEEMNKQIIEIFKDMRERFEKYLEEE